MQSIEFYQNHLDRVSRSFAYCIARLDEPLRRWVSLSYLLCRALDSIEDAPWTSRHGQKQAFINFEEWLKNFPSTEQVTKLLNSFPPLPDSERALLCDLNLLLLDFHSLPEVVRGPLREAILSMSRGMQFFQGKRLKSLAEVNQYCFFVAGLVGELLNHLVSQSFPQFNVPTKLRAHHFGLFLQKINLLKDQKQDEAEGRFLVHSRTELLASLRKDAQEAFAYLMDLPRELRGYRLFCATSLFLGLESLPWFERGWLGGMVNKLPKVFAAPLLQSIEGMIDSETALNAFFQTKLILLPATKQVADDSERTQPAWFASLYSVSTLPQQHLASLGL